MKKLATTMTLCALLFGLGSCADAEKDPVGKSPSTSGDSAIAEAGEGRDAPPPGAVPLRYSVTQTSWDVEETPAQGPTPPPLVITWEEGQRQEFERDASKRWQNTEIFVRKRK